MLLVMVYMANGLAESGENLVKMWELVNAVNCRSSARDNKDALGRGVHLLLSQETFGQCIGRPKT